MRLSTTGFGGGAAAAPGTPFGAAPGAPLGTPFGAPSLAPITGANEAAAQALPGLPAAVTASAADDLAFLSDAARSKVVALVRSISTQIANGAAALSRDAGREAGSAASRAAKGRDRLRAVWTESLANDISARAYNEASIRISRERREVWVCRPGNGNDPAPKTYRMQEQPKDFETHMKLWEASTRGFDLSIEYLRKSLTKLEAEAMPEEAAMPPPARVFGRRQVPFGASPSPQDVR